MSLLRSFSNLRLEVGLSDFKAVSSSPQHRPPLPYTQLSGYHPQIIPEIFVKMFKATLPTKEVAYSLECWIKHRETIKAYAIQPLAL